MTKYIIVFRQHGDLMCQTRYIGPYDSHDEAYDGVRFIQELET